MAVAVGGAAVWAAVEGAEGAVVVGAEGAVAGAEGAVIAGAEETASNEAAAAAAWAWAEEKDEEVSQFFLKSKKIFTEFVPSR